MEEAPQSDAEDDLLLLVQFSGVGIDEVINSEPPPPFKIIGLEKNEPIIQIGPQFYAGKVENSPGTNLFFKTALFDPEHEYEEIDKDLQAIPEVWANYEGKSCKVLNVKRIYPKQKVITAEEVTTEVAGEEEYLEETNEQIMIGTQ
ncbi:uncharacterized protein LOC132199537 [Neocloeon triangulifer]|uniref:uncharacterized protein LOC132199537 n=1 Tax=Neocloeon triangulifer TaxID=2078957 RepID=UPI00286F1306|nr:uncharacterized protein LOC132199537 [Neocloeon triangulifer]